MSRIKIGPQPAPEGMLSVGLSRKTGAEWSATRWMDLEVNQDGTARLEHRKPGTYRLLRNIVITADDAGVRIEGPASGEALND